MRGTVGDFLITLAQAKAYTSALLKGDLDALGIIKQSFREVFPS